MDDTKLLGKIGELIDTKLQPIKTQLGVVENKLGHANERIESLDRKIEIVIKKIDKAQEERIEVLSELVTSGHNMHEKRIKRVEDNLQLPHIQ